MLRSLPWLILFTVTAGAGVVSGKLGNRWGTPPDMQVAAERVSRLPAEFGRWVLIDESPLEASVVTMLQCAASTTRSYRNAETGETVHLSLIVGPPGPTSVHSPEICFSSQGYHVDVPAERRNFKVSSAPADEATASTPARQASAGPKTASFWKTTFAPDQRQPVRLIAYYGWCDGQNWLAPDRPRFAFGGLPYLYKLQLATKVIPRGDEEADPCDDFLRALLPALTERGFYTNTPSATGRGAAVKPPSPSGRGPG